jgi:hypothetical protein
MSAPKVKRGGVVAVDFVDPGVQRQERHVERQDRRAKAHKKRLNEDMAAAKASEREEQEDFVTRVKRQKLEFDEAFRVVLDVGRGGLSKRERKAVERQRLIDLGCRPPPPPKMPLPILRSMRKTHAKREAARLEAAKQSGLVLATGKETMAKAAKRKTREREKAGRKDQVNIHGTRAGRFKNGILHLNSDSTG